MAPKFNNSFPAMIVDRSPLDDGEFIENDYFQETQNQRRKDGKIRQKSSRWLPSFRALRKKPVDDPLSHSNKANESTRSFRDKKTSLKSKRTKSSPIPTLHPHEWETFDGVSSAIHFDEFRVGSAHSLHPKREDQFGFQLANNSNGCMVDGNNKGLSFGPFRNEWKSPKPSSTRTSSLLPTTQSSPFETPPDQKIRARNSEIMPALLDSESMEDFEDSDDEDSPLRYDDEIGETTCLGITPMSIPNKMSPFATPPTYSDTTMCLGISPFCIPTEISPFAIPPMGGLSTVAESAETSNKTRINTL